MLLPSPRGENRSGGCRSCTKRCSEAKGFQVCTTEGRFLRGGPPLEAFQLGRVKRIAALRRRGRRKQSRNFRSRAALRAGHGACTQTASAARRIAVPYRGTTIPPASLRSTTVRLAQGRHEKTRLPTEAGFSVDKTDQNLPSEPEFSWLGMYSSRLPGRIALSTMPAIEATARPERAMRMLPTMKEIAPVALLPAVVMFAPR